MGSKGAAVLLESSMRRVNVGSNGAAVLSKSSMRRVKRVLLCWLNLLTGK